MKTGMKIAAALVGLAVGQTGFASQGCLNKIEQAALTRATQELNPDFQLHLVGGFAFSQTLYRVTFNEFAREVRADVTIDNACNVLAISVDEDSDSN